jgi:hypothetical protein
VSTNVVNFGAGLRGLIIQLLVRSGIERCRKRKWPGASLKRGSIQEIGEGLMQQVVNHANGFRQTDDITTMLLKYLGGS